MKQVTTKIEVFETPETNLTDVKIGDNLFNVVIKNSRDTLAIEFQTQENRYDKAECEYSISIRDYGIVIHRHVYRPNHDHDDVETLCAWDIDKDKPHAPREVFWSTRSVGTDLNGRMYSAYYIPFIIPEVGY